MILPDRVVVKDEPSHSDRNPEGPAEHGYQKAVYPRIRGKAYGQTVRLSSKLHSTARQDMFRCQIRFGCA